MVQSLRGHARRFSASIWYGSCCAVARVQVTALFKLIQLSLRHHDRPP
jgi:hypothetical protein